MKHLQDDRQGRTDQEHIQPGFEEEAHRANLTWPPSPVDEMTDHQNALYYPFHLCSEETLALLLRHFHAVHFRDYMAVQLTPFFGTTAFHDRMGDGRPDLISTGRLIQGYKTSGALDADMEVRVNQDLADPDWRRLFHQAFTEQRRFQRGLFDPSHGMILGNRVVPGPAALLCLMEGSRVMEPYTVQTVRRLSASQSALADSYQFEYGLALIKTAASGIWTRRIVSEHGMSAVTDSPGHYALLRRSCDRDRMKVVNRLLLPDGTLETETLTG